MNPYEPPAAIESHMTSGNRGGTLLRGGFLFREIEFYTPFAMKFYYSGWNFVQRIRIDGEVVWSRISWITIHRHAEFRLPVDVDPQQQPCEMKIMFSAGLRMRRFTLKVGNQTIWDDGGDRMVRGKPGWNLNYESTLD